MPLPAADTPDFHQSHTLHDTNELPAGTTELLVTVATAGNLALQMRGDSAAVVYGVGVGTHIIPGRFLLAKSTGTTAVLVPANVVIARCNAKRGEV